MEGGEAGEWKAKEREPSALDRWNAAWRPESAPRRESYNRIAAQRRPMGTDTDDRAEACGRCSMTSVVSVAAEGEGGPRGRNPFDGPRIELEDDQVRSVSPHVVALGRLKDRLNRWATAVTYGR